MAEVNWRRVCMVSSLIFSLVLICGSIYLHLQQKNRLGRLRHEGKLVPIEATSGLVEAADLEEMVYLLNQSYHLPGNDYSSEEGGYDNEFISSQSIRSLDILDMCRKLGALLTTEDYPNNGFESRATTFASPQSGTHAVAMTETCLQCICETTTGCKTSMCSNNQLCGVFRISHSYWADAGSPMLEGSASTESQSTDLGYRQCVNNVHCAARTVYAFVDKYARDCNEDGTIDCRDHIALHINGPTGCIRRKLLAPFYERMEQCLSSNA